MGAVLSGFRRQLSKEPAGFAGAPRGPDRLCRSPVASARPAVAADAMKGVSAWVFPGVRKALSKSGASWYYTEPALELTPYGYIMTVNAVWLQLHA